MTPMFAQIRLLAAHATDAHKVFSHTCGLQLLIFFAALRMVVTHSAGRLLYTAY